MDSIFYFLRSSLVRPLQSSRIRLKVDLHFPAGFHVARFLVVGKCITINLIEAGGIASIENNGDVVQFGTAIQFELLKVGSLDGEQCSLAVRLGKLKARCGLLDVKSQLIRNFVQHIALARARVEKHSRLHRGKYPRNHNQPAAKAVDGKGHAGSSLIEGPMASRHSM